MRSHHFFFAVLQDATDRDMFCAKLVDLCKTCKVNTAEPLDEVMFDPTKHATFGGEGDGKESFTFRVKATSGNGQFVSQPDQPLASNAPDASHSCWCSLASVRACYDQTLIIVSRVVLHSIAHASARRYHTFYWQGWNRSVRYQCVGRRSGGRCSEPQSSRGAHAPARFHPQLGCKLL
eukprot:SAG11_NODE_1864_length_4154_cov_1.816769_5_plen_178_part_00